MSVFATICFGHKWWPSSGSSLVFRRVQLMRQHVSQKGTILNTEWRNSSTHSLSRHWMEMSDKLHALAALRWGPKPIGELQSRFGRFGKETNVFFLPGTEPRYLSCPARSLVTIQTNTCRLITKNVKHYNHRGRVDSRIGVQFPARTGAFMGPNQTALSLSRSLSLSLSLSLGVRGVGHEALLHLVPRLRNRGTPPPLPCLQIAMLNKAQVRFTFN